MGCSFINDSLILATQKDVNNNLNNYIRFIFALFLISMKALLVDFGSTRLVIVGLNSSFRCQNFCQGFFGSLSLSLSPDRSCMVTCRAEL